MENIIYCWIKNLILEDKLDMRMIDNSFKIEDGMSLNEYYNYEKNSFERFSKIFDLDQNFKIEIIHKEEIIKESKTLCFIYVLNKYSKIAFKMTLTISNNHLITSNDYYSQIVPKYVIENGQITGIGMAIKSFYDLEDIVCPNLEKEYLSFGANFKEDGFYSAKFKGFSLKNKKYKFYLKYKNRHELEKRIIYFDNFNTSDCPVLIDEEKIEIINNKYPVNLAVYKSCGKVDNYVYPRNIILLKKGIKEIIATDVLDNDWKIEIS